MELAPLLPELISVPGGCFWMGDDAGRPEERPRHLVELASFSVARLVVTNAEYARFLVATDSEPPPFWRAPAFSAPGQPVVGVCWNDARRYCDWLRAQTGYPYRLPTEAEWERAARGGQEGADYAWGDELPTLAGVSLATIEQRAPLVAGTSPPNGYGVCDAGFNVHEWCLDWYDAGYYAHSPRVNPTGPTSGRRRSSRGGAWRHQIKVSRCAARSSLVPSFRYSDYGFRVFAAAV